MLAFVDFIDFIHPLLSLGPGHWGGGGKDGREGGAGLIFPTPVLYHSSSSHLEFIDVTPESLGSFFLPKDETLLCKALKVGSRFWRKPVVPPGTREGQHTATSREDPTTADQSFL